MSWALAPGLPLYTAQRTPPEPRGVVTPLARLSWSGKLRVELVGAVWEVVVRAKKPGLVWPVTVRLPVIAVAPAGTPSPLKPVTWKLWGTPLTSLVERL